jgi:hypothetical protein
MSATAEKIEWYRMRTGDGQDVLVMVAGTTHAELCGGTS